MPASMRLIEILVCLHLWGCSKSPPDYSDSSTSMEPMTEDESSVHARSRRRRAKRRVQRITKVKQDKGLVKRRPMYHIEGQVSQTPIINQDLGVAALPEPQLSLVGKATNLQEDVNQSPVSREPVDRTTPPVISVGTTTTPDTFLRDRAVDVMMRLLEEYLRRIHVNDGTIDPDWNRIKGLDIPSETLAYIAEDMRERVLSAFGPSCAFTQLLAVVELEEEGPRNRLQLSAKEESVCVCSQMYHQLSESLEHGGRQIASSFQERTNDMYVLFGSVVAAKVSLDSSFEKEFRLRSRITRILRDVKAVSV